MPPSSVRELQEANPRSSDGSPSYPLKKWDVITKIGDADVDDEGMIKIGPNLRVRFEYGVQKVVGEGKVPLTLVRGGKLQKIDLPVSPRRPMLIPDLGGAYPQYFVYGPMVFSAASTQMIASINRDSIDGLTSMGHPLMARRGDKPGFEGEQLVIVSAPFFPHRLARDFGRPLAGP